jgi:hypothetical protein
MLAGVCLGSSSGCAPRSCVSLLQDTHKEEGAR